MRVIVINVRATTRVISKSLGEFKPVDNGSEGSGDC